MEIEVYSFEDKDGIEEGWTTINAIEAREHARQCGLKMIANTYEWTDSETVEDHTKE